MAIVPVIRDRISYGPQLHVLGGQFSFGQMTIPYFTSHLTLSELREFIQTPAELTEWTDEDEEIEALYQRSIDYQRVNHSILPYLSDDSDQKPKFFNSITVALVPRLGSSFTPFSNSSLVAPPKFPRETNTSELVRTGPLLLGFYTAYDADDSDTYLMGEICWNKDQVACVTIDGQHRLQALKKLAKTNPELGKQTRISVIFVVPSQELGYRHNYSSDEDSLVKLLRSVFIDLNKHTVPVRRSRLILLDDVDPQSLLVRRLVGTKLRTVALLPLETGDYRLPLPLVDWHGDAAKFDSGPYVTTVLMLDRIVQTLLGVKTVRDWADKRAVSRQITALRRYGYECSDECNERFEAFDKSEEDWQNPFSYPSADLDAIVQTVGSNFAEIVFTVLTQHAPYVELSQLRFDNEMLSADFSSWYERYTTKDKTDEDLAAFNSVSNHVKGKDPAPNTSIWENLLDERISTIKCDLLQFKVIFQDAMFLCLRHLFRCDVLVLGPGESVLKNTQAHRLYWTKILVSSMNLLYESNSRFWCADHEFESFDDRRIVFWLGSVAQVSDLTIDFTNSGRDRAASWLKLISLLHAASLRWKKLHGDPGENIDVFLDNLEREDGDYEKIAQTDIKRLTFGVPTNAGAMKRVARVQIESKPDDDRDEIDDRIDKIAGIEMKRRLNYVWGLLK